MTDFMLVHDRGSSHFGEVANGKIQFSRAPHTYERRFMGLSVRDEDGGLWVPASDQGSAGSSDWVRGQLALRITDKGIVQKIENAGWAKLKDQSGQIWLGKIWGEEENLFNIWRDGKIVHSVRVPGAYEESSMVSNRPGSVFMWTKLGIQHMVANDPNKPSNYQLGKLYTLKNADGVENAIAYSALGFLVVPTYHDHSGQRRYFLHLIKLPKDDSSE